MRIEPQHLDGLVALSVAETTPLHKLPDERDTEFIKRIVCAYINAYMQLKQVKEEPRRRH